MAASAERRSPRFAWAYRSKAAAALDLVDRAFRCGVRFGYLGEGGGTEGILFLHGLDTLDHRFGSDLS